MAVTVTHTKVCNIPDNQTNLARGEVCPSHWNEEHTLVGIDIIENNLRSVVIVDMSNDDYTMTDAEANSALIVISNVGDGTKTLTWPTSSDATRPVFQVIVTLFASNPFTIAAQSGGATATVLQAGMELLTVPDGLGAYNLSGQINTQGRKASNGVETLAAGDNAFNDALGGRLLYGDDGSAQTITIAAGNYTPNLSAPVFCYGAGGITIQGDMGVTVIGNVTLVQGDKVTIYRDGSTETYICA